MRKLFIITLEPIEQRYTKQWYDYFKREFGKYFNVTYIDGIFINDKIDKGRFLDINKTNLWKAEQVKVISQLFMEEKIKDGDIFFFMDGWHFGITATKYMTQLNNVKCKIYTYWHAGTWDRYDFISQAGLREWASNNEKGWFNALDGSFVATKFHKNLICNYFKFDKKEKDKISVVGFPMDWQSVILKEGIDMNAVWVKFGLIAFPHRLDKEKQPDWADNLQKKITEYRIVKTMEVTNNKKEYYNKLKRCMVAFSASLQETFGIGTVEALMFNCVPIVPNRLSYVELYPKEFRYKTFDEAVSKVKYYMKHYKDKKVVELVNKTKQKIIKQSNDSVDMMSRKMIGLKEDGSIR